MRKTIIKAITIALTVLITLALFILPVFKVDQDYLFNKYDFLVKDIMENDDPDSAIDWVEKAVNLAPCEYYYETLFQAYIRAGFYDRIIECEKTILRNYAKNFSLLFNLALAHKNLKQNLKAIELYEKALKINPSSYNAWFNLAHLYEVEAQCKNAVSAYKICKNACIFWYKLLSLSSIKRLYVFR